MPLSCAPTYEGHLEKELKTLEHGRYVQCRKQITLPSSALAFALVVVVLGNHASKLRTLNPQNTFDGVLLMQPINTASHFR